MASKERTVWSGQQTYAKAGSRRWQWMRLDKQQFQEILTLIEPSIMKQDTRLRKAVTPEERLAITHAISRCW